MEGPLTLDIDHAGQPIIAASYRGLKGGSGGGRGGGGSYGGGGSSSGSRGGYYYGSSSRSNCNNYDTNTYNDCNNSTPIWIVIVGIAAAVIGLCFCCWFVKKKTAESPGDASTPTLTSTSTPKPGSDASFDEAVALARTKTYGGDVMSAAVAANEPAFESYEGDFTMKYVDRGNVHDGSAKIRMKNTGVGSYKMEGEANDADGIASITEGYASRSGAAWWVEETMSGPDVGLKVLTEGTFDFSNNTFAGTWKANNGIRGTYVEFAGTNVNKTYAPGGGGGGGGGMANATPQTLEQMLQEDIPMAVATVETATPAGPYVVQATSETEENIPSVSAIPEPTTPYVPAADQTSGQGPYVPRY